MDNKRCIIEHIKSRNRYYIESTNNDPDFADLISIDGATKGSVHKNSVINYQIVICQQACDKKCIFYPVQHKPGGKDE